VSEIEILGSFNSDPRPQSAAEIIATTRLPRSTVFRSLRLLLDAGFLYQLATSKRYVLGPRMLQLGMLARRQLSSEDLIAPPLLDLVQQTSESVTFSILDIPYRICAYVLEAPSDLRHVVQVGARYPLHLGAAGKAILAHLPADLVESLCRNEGLSKAEIANVKRDLGQASELGWIVTTSERVPGATSVAAPVFVGEAIYGSVAVVGPSARMAPLMDRHRPAVQKAAKSLTELFTKQAHTNGAGPTTRPGRSRG
jgi:DNA-binding IclR family transcriptional regulator